jgi:3-oxoacyl-[acyl-carrier protein] reductase
LLKVIFDHAISHGPLNNMINPVLATKAGQKMVASAIPLGRAGTAEEIAGPILFVASDLANFMTGEIINVNGGAVLCG